MPSRIERTMVLSLRAGVMLAIAAAPGRAQEQLVARRAVVVTPIFESWQFTDGFAHGGARIERATQWSVPVMISVAATDRWTVDLSTAHANGIVTLDRTDSRLGSRELTLAGLADVHVRATGRFLGDQLLLTIGGVAPAGRTNLDPEELSAMRVLSAPALSFQTPVLGGGAGATVGVVYARSVGAWAWAAGTSYEYRGRYTPATFAAGIPTPDFSPGGVAHLSLGADGLIGAHGATVSGTLDLFGRDRLRAGSGAAAPATRLGPVATVDARLAIAAPAFRELSLYVVDRYRSSFQRNGETVAESAGNYLDAGVHAVYPLSARTGLLTALNARHHTGLAFDDGIQTAAIASGALTLGVTRSLGGGFELSPFARGQLGTVKSGNESTSVRGVAGGVTLARRF